MSKRKPNIKFFHVFGCKFYLLNDYDDVGKLKAKEDIGVFVGYSKESAAFGIYNKRTQESSSSLLNNDVQQSLEEVEVSSSNTQSISNDTISNVDEASTSHNVFNELLEDTYFDASTSFYDPIFQQFSAARTPQQNGVVERRNRTLVEAARTMLTFANLLLFLWAEAIATAYFTQNRSIIHKRFDKTPYELMSKRKPNIKFFHVFGCKFYLLNDYDDVGKLKAKEDIGVFVGYSKESAAFGIYNKRTRKTHESVNVNFDEISEMASKQFSLEPGLSNLNETGKSLNPSVSQLSETSKKDLEDLFHNF
nr:retrovirus-related Pol polyprotein from transposon TNT 1-94 [Tanacetum cinerariifolium]